MPHLTRLLILLVVAALAVMLVAGLAFWSLDEVRRVRRGLKRVLKGDAHGFLAALGRGRGIGFNFTSHTVAVVWDKGSWGLVYALDELMGAEVIVDRQVVDAVDRGKGRRGFDASDAELQVALRLVFDDTARPDFVLDLWLPEDSGRRNELAPREAIAEAKRWLGRIETMLRQPSRARPVAPALGPAAEPR